MICARLPLVDWCSIVRIFVDGLDDYHGYDAGDK